jgi:hypothetical protein
VNAGIEVQFWGSCRGCRGVVFGSGGCGGGLWSVTLFSLIVWWLTCVLFAL